MGNVGRSADQAWGLLVAGVVQPDRKPGSASDKKSGIGRPGGRER
jgi:hypothetical protein